jgi:hypothetical protein
MGSRNNAARKVGVELRESKPDATRGIVPAGREKFRAPVGCQRARTIPERAERA